MKLANLGKLVGVVVASLFVVGGVNGWENAHSRETLLDVASRDARIEPQRNGDFLIDLRCAGRNPYVQRVRDLGYQLRAEPAKILAIEAMAASVIAHAKKVNETSAVTAGVIGGGGLATRYEEGFKSLRAAVFAEEMPRAEKVGTGVLLVLAAVGGYLGGYAVLNDPPGCNSTAIDRFLNDPASRQALQDRVYSMNSVLVNNLQQQLESREIACRTPTLTIGTTKKAFSNRDRWFCEPDAKNLLKAVDEQIAAFPRFTPLNAGQRDYAALFKVCSALAADGLLTCPSLRRKGA